MSEPIDIFCDIVSKIPSPSLPGIINQCIFSLDGRACNNGPIENPIETLKTRMNALADHGIHEQFIIYSLFHFIIDRFNNFIDPRLNSDVVDLHLKMIDEAKSIIETTQSEEEKLRMGNIKSVFQDALPSRYTGKENAKIIIEYLEQAKKDNFPLSYWVRRMPYWANKMSGKQNPPKQ